MEARLRAVLAASTVALIAAVALPAVAQKSTVDIPKRAQKAREVVVTLSDRKRSEKNGRAHV